MLTPQPPVDGDAISRQYSSTAALKGDYTRTKRRDYRGALNDFGLTLSRYYNNIVNDYFSQAAIDFLLGNVTEQVFEEFEADMMSNDPAISMRKVRANAIDTSSKIVIAEQREDLVGGWTVLSPKEPNTLRTFPFEEIILLLTDAALYAVRFDWNLEKVSSFERVDLRSVAGKTEFSDWYIFVNRKRYRVRQLCHFDPHSDPEGRKQKCRTCDQVSTRKGGYRKGQHAISKRSSPARQRARLGPHNCNRQTLQSIRIRPVVKSRLGQVIKWGQPNPQDPRFQGFTSQDKPRSSWRTGSR